MSKKMGETSCEDSSLAPRFGQVLVLGLGVSGSAVARFCLDALQMGSAAVCGLTIYAGKRTEATALSAAPFVDAGIEVVFDSENVRGRYDTCVVSPGISANSAFYHAACAVSSQVMSEPEFAYLLSPRNWIGVTGTNGKTTTTALLAHLMRTAGFSARAVGNIGDTCIEAVRNRTEGEYLVAELSSYQLASTHRFSPRVAILLNITPDHLAWHGSHEAYIAAKMKIFDNLEFDGLAVLDATNPDARACADVLMERGVRVLLIDTSRDTVALDGAGCIGGRLTVSLQGLGRFELASTDEMLIKGEHNVINALAAATAAIFCGADASAVTEGLKTFRPLEHRIEPCGVVDGVEFYNDSKATNTDATCKALTAFGTRPLVLLLGGKDKGTDLSDLVDACVKRCKAVVCFGEARERFVAAFKGTSLRVLSASGMKDAVDVARGIASSGDVIALSPACASFDEFTSFEHRGTVFKDYIAHLPGVTLPGEPS